MRQPEKNGEDARGGLRARARRAGFGLAVLVLVVYAIFGAEGLLEQYGRYQKFTALEARHADELAMNERLAGEVEALRSDPLAIERAARLELDYQRPGEVVFVLESPDPLENAARFDSDTGAP